MLGGGQEKLMIAVLIQFLGLGMEIRTLSGADQRPETRRLEDAPTKQQVQIEVFTRPESERCRLLVEVLKKLEQERTGIAVVERDVVNDLPARERFWKMAKDHGIEKAGVPACCVCNSFQVGFRDAETTRRKVDEALSLHAYVREGCPHCRDAKAFLSGLQKRWPAIRVQLHDVVQDKAALQQMHEVAAKHRTTVVALPCILLCGRFSVGYDNDQTTGQQLERLLEESQPPRELKPKPQRESGASFSRRASQISLVFYLPEVTHQTPLPIPDDASPENSPIPNDSPIPEAADSARQETSKLEGFSTPPPEEIDLPLFGHLRVREVGMPAFTIAIGLVDGFNPCAMWVLIFLLSILVNIGDRKRIVLIAGTFVVVSGLAYFAFMAAWLNVFQLIGLARPVQVTLGLLATTIGLINVKDFVAFHKGVSLSIPESAKPGLYARVRGLVQAKYVTAALFGAATLAVFVNVVEILCTAGLPALYTQILMLQKFPAWKNYLYLGLYNLAYMLDDSVMLTIAVVTLSHRKMQEREGRWLKLISGSVMLGLGLTMVFRPDWLS